MRPLQAILFDLDGTLADTAVDLGGAINAMMRKRGLPEVPFSAIRPIASSGTNGLIAHALGVHKGDPGHLELRAEFLNEYEHCFLARSQLFEGVQELIAAIDAQGLVWGIITNKPHRFTERLVPKLGFQIPPAVVVSYDTVSEPKPSVKPMLHACAQINIAPEACLYLGDAECDVVAGNDAGMYTVLANWGYISDHQAALAWGPDADINAPLDLLSVIAQCGVTPK
ncbi:MAG: HAD-IA family hydrolase [Neisseriaceae bacterium]|nr:HAD-IA family hydrolase [Neisseriaceae bacterium]